MKKLNITKKQFGESKYFTDKYGKLEYVSESGQFYKTTKGEVLKFIKESKDMVNEDAVDDDLKLLDQYCSGIRGNLNDSTDPDGLSIKNRIANFIGWKDSKAKWKFDNNNGLVTEGAGAGYDITVKGIEIDNIIDVKIGDGKGSFALFTATIKPGVVTVTAEGYYDTFCHDEYVKVEGGKIYGTVYDIEYFNSVEDATDFVNDQLMNGTKLEITASYGAGYIHSYLPENGDIWFKDVDCSTDYYDVDSVELKSPEMSDAVNIGYDNLGSDDE